MNQGRMYVGTEDRGLLISENEGEDWKKVEKFKKEKIHAIVLLPSMGKDQPSPVFASVGSSLFQTWDGGNTWKEMLPANELFPPYKNGGSHPFILTLGASPLVSDFLYSGWSSGKGIVGIPIGVKGGEKWVSLNRGLVNSSVMDLIASKHDPSTIISATWGSGLLKSENGGKDWQPINVGFEGNIAHSISEDPQNPEILYAGAEDGIYKTVDGGQHWKIAGQKIRRPIDIVVDPKNTEIVYAASWGEGFLKSMDVRKPLGQFE